MNHNHASDRMQKTSSLPVRTGIKVGEIIYDPPTLLGGLSSSQPLHDEQLGFKYPKP